MKKLFDEIFPEHASKRIVVWGTGKAYHRINDLVELKIDYFVDNDQTLSGTLKDNIKVYNPNCLCNKDMFTDNHIIIVASIFFNEIINQISRYNINLNQIVSRDNILERYIRIKKKERGIDIKKFNRGELLLDYFSNFNSLKYRGIDLSIALAKVYNNLVCFLQGHDTIIHFNQTVIKHNFKINGNGPIFVAFPFHGRKDHDDLYSNVFLPMKNYVTKFTEDCGLGNPFVYNHFVDEKSEITQEVKNRIDLLNISFNDYEIKYLIFQFQYAAKMVDYLKNEIDLAKIKILVSYVDSYLVDNILLQLCKTQNIETCLMQHGLNIVDNSAIEIIKDRQFALTKYKLVWGYESAKRMIAKGNSKESIQVLGNPKNNITRIEFDKLKREKLLTYNKFAVLLSVDDEKNIEIIDKAEEIARILNIRYIIRAHPLGIEKQYINKSKLCEGYFDKIQNIKELFKIIDFAISDESTTFFEGLFYGIPVFIYNKSDEKYDDSIQYFEFKSVTKLLKELNKYTQSDKYVMFSRKIKETSKRYMDIDDRLKPSERYQDFFIKRLEQFK